MDELQSNSEWREAARWLKFEEDVENGGRWSKPYVATLQLHSLFELRSCLTNGAILFDLPGDDLNAIVDSITDYLVRTRHIDESKRDLVKNSLLLKHIHQHEKGYSKLIDIGEKRTFPLIKSISDMTKKFSTNDLQSISSSQRLNQNASSSLLSAYNVNINSSSRPNFDNNIQPLRKIDSKAKDFLTIIGSTHSVSSNRSDYKTNQNFMRKIPVGAEASNVLVGEVDFLEHQFSIFVRLSKALILADFTEVPVPTRFLFIILGPKGNISKYHEIGRSISTLLSDEIFHDIAYRAKTRNEILRGFDVFLDQVTVLPPGEWDPNIRLKPPEKIPLKEERLEKIQNEMLKQNGHANINNNKISPIQSHDSDPNLKFTGRFCGGLIDDIKRKYPWFWSDLKDGLNFQCISSIMFMYFACLAPIITFGGLLGTATGNNMSAIESLLSGLICGVLFGLFSGQPMTILGSTGPVLVFEKIVKDFSDNNGLDYMGFRAAIGLWTCLILIIVVVTDCSALVKYITRFTEEAFASLIALIFIIESMDKLIAIKKTHKYSNNPINYYEKRLNETQCFRCSNSSIYFNDSINSLNEIECNKLGPNFKLLAYNCKYSPDVFFVSIFLYALTFFLAMTLRSFRTSRFFPSAIRSKVADFGVIITIAVAVFTDWYLGFDTPKLMVPLKFETTIPTRGWFINPIERNKEHWWYNFGAILPALLATILIFMDQHITTVIINRKENKLKKGNGYHLDLLIVAITIGINSLLGIPWFVAATVLSINHVLSLKKESEAAAPGEKPQFLGVVEQRITSVIVFLMIGLSVFLAKYLRLIPMPVLYGVFLYMGISSLNGIQFMHRIVIMFMPEKHQPDYIFLRHVRTRKVHLFTLIQLASIAFLWIIKSNRYISITFPLMVLALVGIRKLMDFFVFTQKELSYLDDIMPEIVKRSEEDGHDLENTTQKTENESPKNKTINISNELSKTNVWMELQNDKQVVNRKEIGKKNNSSDDLSELPLLSNTASVKPKFIINNDEI